MIELVVNLKHDTIAYRPSEFDSCKENPVNYIAKTHVIAVTKSLFPGSAEAMTQILRSSGTYYIWDDGEEYQVACPVSVDMSTWHLLDNTSGKVSFLSNLTRPQLDKVYNYNKLNEGRGRFDISHFPFSALVTRPTGDNAEAVAKAIRTIDFTHNVYTSDHSWRNIPAIVPSLHCTGVGIDPVQFSTDGHLEIMMKFIKAMQTPDSQIIRDAFWYEPIIAHGNPQKYTVSESRHRSLAAKVLGISHIPVLFE